MANLSDYAENLLVAWLARSAAVTRPTGWHVALFTSAPSDTGGGIEVTGSGYARQAVTFGPATATSGQTVNEAAVVFAATGGWGTVTHMGIFDAASAGNLLWHGPLVASRSIGSGDTYTLPAGSIVASLAQRVSNHLKKRALDWLMTTAAVARPSAWYLALYSTAPNDNGGGVEVTGSGYARQPVTFGAPADGVSISTNQQSFGATSDWDVVTAAGIFDAASGGNLLWHGPLSGTRQIGNGDSLPFPAGAVSVSLA